VIPYYPRTAQKLVNGKVKLSSAALGALVTGVLAGLEELKTACSRSHGNLKPSNVLLAPGELSPASVALTDPAPSRVAAQGGEAADLYALGELIYQLVTYRQFRGQAGRGWPIPADPEWKRLGPSRGCGCGTGRWTGTGRRCTPSTAAGSRISRTASTSSVPSGGRNWSRPTRCCGGWPTASAPPRTPATTRER